MFGRAIVFGAILWFVPVIAAQNVTPQSSMPAESTTAAYVGDRSCAGCHADKFATFERTAHHLTSTAATSDTIKGTFDGASATMTTRDANLLFRLEARAEGFFQTAIHPQSPEKNRTERFDIVTGSGRRGQTYLFWKDDSLFQLPVSYFAQNRTWINSPGFEDGAALFARPISQRCLECHTTLATPIALPNRYDKATVVLGVGCEKCHGPGRTHIEQQKTAPGPQGIVNTARLSRDRQLELCESCHGRLAALTPAFSYRPGEPLAAHFRQDTSLNGTPFADDVHGNQVGMLKQSKCFQSSQMTCATCHDVHREQRDVAALAQKCAGCHRIQACRRFKKEGQKIAGKCVDCHMPIDTSKSIVFASAASGPMVAVERSHRIAVYRDN